jgi:transcriptional regulator with XRE-family HTH domain
MDVQTTGRRSRKSLTTANGRASHAVVKGLMSDLDRSRRDAGVSLRRLGAACGVSQSHLSQVFAGQREPSISVLTAISRALGGSLSVRFYPNTGPVIHDGIQARIVEELLRIAAPTWTNAIEVPVFRPARGFIDVIFDSEPLATIVAGEVESRIDRLEQQLRWAQEKAASLPSSEFLARTKGDRVIYRLLVLRATAATREIARRFESVLRVAYPAPAEVAFASLTTGVPWPGDGILWADVAGDNVRIRDHPPRGIDVGR